MGLSGLSAIMGLVSIIISLFFYPALLVGISSENDFSSYQSAAEAYKKSRVLFGSYVVLVSLMIIAIMGGFMLLIVPALYVAVLISITPYVWLFEGKKGKDAISGSWHYIKGKWWAVFLRYLSMALILGVVQSIVTSVFSSIFPAQQLDIPSAVGSFNIPTSFLAVSSPQVVLATSLLSYLFSLPITFILGYLVYKFLGSKKILPVDEGLINASKKSVSRFVVLGIIALVLLILAVIGSFLFALFQLRGLM